MMPASVNQAWKVLDAKVAGGCKMQAAFSCSCMSQCACVCMRRSKALGPSQPPRPLKDGLSLGSWIGKPSPTRKIPTVQAHPRCMHGMSNRHSPAKKRGSSRHALPNTWRHRPGRVGGLPGRSLQPWANIIGCGTPRHCRCASPWKQAWGAAKMGQVGGRVRAKDEACEGHVGERMRHVRVMEGERDSMQEWSGFACTHVLAQRTWSSSITCIATRQSTLVTHA
eukprot:1143226-Pelagomonas_calceolata.AAC.5